MNRLSRRSVTTTVLAVLPWKGVAAQAPDDHRRFAAEALRMRDSAVAAGDQPYGAVLVLDGVIAGYGSSRVVSDNNIDAHAERVALWAAQKALGRSLLDGAVIYASSRPCALCQRALAAARVSEMRVGPDAVSAGAPQR